jgi:hypothetical protein
MFGTSHTEVWEESEYKTATAQNLKLVLLSMRGELLGDPYFGMLLKQYTFEQNSYILRDILADLIYTQVAVFIPQLKVERSGIRIFQDRRKGHLLCQIHGVNKIDYTPNTFELLLLSNNESA